MTYVSLRVRGARQEGQWAVTVRSARRSTLCRSTDRTATPSPSSPSPLHRAPLSTASSSRPAMSPRSFRRPRSLERPAPCSARGSARSCATSAESSDAVLPPPGGHEPSSNRFTWLGRSSDRFTALSKGQGTLPAPRNPTRQEASVAGPLPPLPIAPPWQRQRRCCEGR